MKKIVKISLGAAIILASAQNVSADTLAQAFENGKVSGEIKSQYFQKEVADKKVNVWTNGGNLSYVTGAFYGFNAGVTAQASTVTSSDLKNAPTAYNSDQNVSGAVLSQAYLQYSVANTTGKVGRQYISTPLVEGSGSRMFKESFEGLVVSNTDIANTTIVAAYVDKEQYRTNIASGGTNVKAVSDFEQVKDGAYTLYVNNKSIKNLTVDAQYALIDSNVNTANDTTVFYAAGSYNINPFTIEAQTYQSDNGNATNSDGSAYAVNLLGNFDKLSLGAAYSTIAKDANIVAGLGNGADYLYTGPWIYGGVYDADTDAYKLSAGYKITTDLSFDLIYGAWKTGTNPTASESDFVATYNFNKNFSTRFILASYDNLANESYRSRLYASYKF
ncbi:MAG: OprD family outer membrane porin [Aliarcobacter sp.]|nr:OprD family outer membrane porin [Aliarcobacter sp.]